MKRTRREPLVSISEYERTLKAIRVAEKIVGANLLGSAGFSIDRRISAEPTPEQIQEIRTEIEILVGSDSLGFGWRKDEVPRKWLVIIERRAQEQAKRRAQHARQGR